MTTDKSNAKTKSTEAATGKQRRLQHDADERHQGKQKGYASTQ